MGREAENSGRREGREETGKGNREQWNERGKRSRQQWEESGKGGDHLNSIPSFLGFVAVAGLIIVVEEHEILSASNDDFKPLKIH